MLPADKGNYCVLRFDADIDDVALCRALKKTRKLSAMPLSACFSEPSGHRGLILGFAGFSDAALKTARRRLAQGLEEFVRKSGSTK